MEKLPAWTIGIDISPMEWIAISFFRFGERIFRWRWCLRNPLRIEADHL